MKKLMNISKISDYTLDDLGDLIGRISDLIDRDYIHVSEHLPQSIIKTLQRLNTEIEKEYEQREL